MLGIEYTDSSSAALTSMPTLTLVFAASAEVYSAPFSACGEELRRLVAVAPGAMPLTRMLLVESWTLPARTRPIVAAFALAVMKVERNIESAYTYKQYGLGNGAIPNISTIMKGYGVGAN
jgi:hypothetical protein